MMHHVTTSFCVITWRQAHAYHTLEDTTYSFDSVESGSF